MSCLGTEPTDKSSWDIKRRIINLLYQRGVSSAQRLNIEMENGTVTVRGTVASFYERQVCVSCCQHVPGVFGLLDEIKVDSPISKPSATERF
jgi:osmotically-inducible protein OsmY